MTALGHALHGAVMGRNGARALPAARASGGGGSVARTGSHCHHRRRWAPFRPRCGDAHSPAAEARLPAGPVHEDTVIIPAGGTSKMMPLASIMLSTAGVGGRRMLRSEERRVGKRSGDRRVA